MLYFLSVLVTFFTLNAFQIAHAETNSADALRDFLIEKSPEPIKPNYSIIEVKMDQVLDQSGTNWCWAYASFHAARSYNFDTDETQNVWDDSLARINSNWGFRSYMHTWRDPSQGGLPQWFFQHFTGKNELPYQNWKAFSPYSDGEFEGKTFCGDTKFSSKRVGTEKSLEEMAQRIVKGLKSGAPSVWCGRGHCVTVYGGVFDTNGFPASYYIADSMHGRRYRANGSRALQSLELLMALGD